RAAGDARAHASARRDATVRGGLDLAPGAVGVRRAGDRRVTRAGVGHEQVSGAVHRDGAGYEPGLAARRAGGSPLHLALPVDRDGAGVGEGLHDVGDAAHVLPVVVRLAAVAL